MGVAPVVVAPEVGMPAMVMETVVAVVAMGGRPVGRRTRRRGDRDQAEGGDGGEDGEPEPTGCGGAALHASRIDPPS